MARNRTAFIKGVGDEQVRKIVETPDPDYSNPDYTEIAVTTNGIVIDDGTTLSLVPWHKVERIEEPSARGGGRT